MATRYASELSTIFLGGVIVADLADYDHKHLPSVPSHALLVFIVSTYGAGDPPDNGISFLDTLCELQQRGCRLENVRYAMFGLGNSNYTHFNKYALDTNGLLEKMGATRLGTLGLGNDRNGATEEDFMVWKGGMVQQVAKEFDLQPVKRGYAPRIRIAPPKIMDSSPDILQVHRQNTPTTPDMSGAVALPIIRARRLTAAKNLVHGSVDLRDCVHLEFSLYDCPSITYETGDYLCISPMNPDREVDAILKLLGVWDTREEAIQLLPVSSTSQPGIRLPSPTTMEGLFRYSLDICGPISREFLGGLTEFAIDPGVRARIEILASQRDVFHDKVTSRRMTLAGLLQDVAGLPIGDAEMRLKLAIPPTYMLENLKRLQPRSYSISSSAIVDPGVVAITTLAVSETFESMSAGCHRFYGVTSNYLKQLHQEFNGQTHDDTVPPIHYSTAGPYHLLQGGKVFARVRRSNFRLPPDPSTPVIMIGAGTGVAPFRAFIQERIKLKMQGLQVGKTLLLVGHRAPDQDYYHNDVWRQAQHALGAVFELYPAFSRAEQQPRQYVQDVLAIKHDQVLKLLANDQPGNLYICGSSAMALGVKKTLAEIWSSRTTRSLSYVDKRAEDWIKSLEDLGHLQEDIWG